MSKQVIAITDTDAKGNEIRTEGVAGILKRMDQLSGESLVLSSKGEEQKTLDALKLLAKNNRLSIRFGENGTEIWYIPSRGSIHNASQNSSGKWLKVSDKLSTVIRTSQGAIFKFMPENPKDCIVEVFITDWSPCPAACAVAVHRDHPFVAQAEYLGENFFSGKYVRHPLTGDLLPVWVANWVKPEFGTGAVLVNPAHDRVDLGFGRTVGLPIRFALVPHNFDGSPNTWPLPPVIKTGVTIKTGFYDGHSHYDAMEEYFKKLQSYDLAERYNDIQVGSRIISYSSPHL